MAVLVGRAVEAELHLIRAKSDAAAAPLTRRITAAVKERSARKVGRVGHWRRRVCYGVGGVGGAMRAACTQSLHLSVHYGFHTRFRQFETRQSGTRDLAKSAQPQVCDFENQIAATRDLAWGVQVNELFRRADGGESAWNDVLRVQVTPGVSTWP